MAYPISDVPRRIVYSGSVGVGPYAFTFEVLTASDIAVYKNTTLLTLTTDYTVSINTGTGTGTVTLVVAATGADTVTLVGDRAIQRTSDFVTGGDLFANTLNAELDAQTIYAQQIDEKADRAIKSRVTDPTTLDMTLPAVASRANKLLGFTAGGQPTVSTRTIAEVDAAVGSFVSGTGNNAATVIYDPAGLSAVPTTVQAKLRETVSVLDFGAVGDGVTDDTVAIQAALDALQTYSAASSGATAYGNSQTLFFPFGRYRISQTLTYNRSYLAIESAGATFLPAVGFDQNTFVFDFYLWQAEIKDLVFSGFDKCIYARNNNDDQGKVQFDNITIHGGQTGFKIDMRSTHTELNNCKWDRTVHPVEIVEGDRVDVNGGWCKQGVMTDAYDGSFLNLATFSVLTLNDVLMVPILSTGLKTAWVKNYGQFRAYNTRFGGESGARAWINNFAQADTGTPPDPRGIIFYGCELYGTIEGVRCFYLPNTIIIRDCVGFADTDAFIHFDPAFETLDNELARVGSNFSYVLDNPQRFKQPPINDAKLLPYLFTGDYTSFGQTNTSTAAPATLLFQNGRDIQQILDTAEYSTFKVELYTVRDTNVDTYSEFTVKGGGNISPGVERVLVTSLRTGADATAPVLFLDTDDLVKIQLNGDTNVRTVFYRITKVGRFFG